jgi:hypothetical protein
MGLAYMDCEYCPPEDEAMYHPLMITRHHPNDARSQEKELADKLAWLLFTAVITVLQSVNCKLWFSQP